MVYQCSIDPATLADRPPAELCAGRADRHPQGACVARALRNLERERPLAERTQAELIAIIMSRVIKPELVAIYELRDSSSSRAAIEADLTERFPRAELAFKRWLSGSFLTSPMAPDAQSSRRAHRHPGHALAARAHRAVAFPLGIGAALYLEEYTATGRAHAVARQPARSETNIYNLAGVPSIIYGILGLAIFVRALEPITSGRRLAGADATANGRTIISAALTMALLVLPVMIISAQEAIRAVPSSLRQASYGLGATRWQTIWQIVLPNALPGILTGTILAMSRAIGETAPLIVVGASTYIVTDPTGPFAKFTVLPIQIYQLDGAAAG